MPDNAPILFDTQELKGGFKQVSCATAFTLSLYNAAFPFAGTTMLYQRAQHRSNIVLLPQLVCAVQVEMELLAKEDG